MFTYCERIIMVTPSPEEGRYHKDEKEGHGNQET